MKKLYAAIVVILFASAAGYSSSSCREIKGNRTLPPEKQGAVLSQRESATTLESVTESMETITDRLIELKKSEQEAEEAQKIEAGTIKSTNQEALLAAIDAKHTAETLQDEINSLPEDADDQARTDLSWQLYNAQIKANIMYEKAGLIVVPYPDILYPE